MSTEERAALIERLEQLPDIIHAATLQWAETDEQKAYYRDKVDAVLEAISALRGR